MTDPVHKLKGATAVGASGDEWEITSKSIDFKNKHDHTGGNHSVGYKVKRKRDGKLAYMKVLDIRSYFKYLPALEAFAEMNKAVTAFDYELSILGHCKTRSLQHVMLPLDHGAQTFDNFDFPVKFAIFDWADTDIRKIISLERKIDIAWLMRSIHQCAVGVMELHTHNIVHQDIKPSNMLVFKDQNKTKVGDLGSAVCREITYAHKIVGGGIEYGPPEQMYENCDAGWSNARISADLYMLGGLIVTTIFNVRLNNQWLSKLPDEVKPLRGSRPYPEVLPFIHKAFSEVLTDLESGMPEEASAIKTDIISMIKCLCNPDPKLRGDKDHPSGNQYSLERIVSSLDLMANKAKLHLTRN